MSESVKASNSSQHSSLNEEGSLDTTSTSPPSAKLQALEKELEQAAIARRRERQKTLQKIAEGEEKNEEEYQEWVKKIKELQEEGDKERERIEKELIEEIDKTRKAREERRRSSSLRSESHPIEIQKPRRGSTDVLHKGRDVDTIFEEFRSHRQHKLSVVDKNNVELEKKVVAEGHFESVGDSKGKEEGKVEDSVKILLQTPIIAEPQEINNDHEDGNCESASGSDNQQPSSDHLFIRENRKGTADAFRSHDSTTKIVTASSPSLVSSSESTLVPQTDSNATLSPPLPTPLATSPSTRQSVAELIRQREAAQLQANEPSKTSQRIKKPTPGRINVMNKVPWAAKDNAEQTASTNNPAHPPPKKITSAFLSASTAPLNTTPSSTTSSTNKAPPPRKITSTFLSTSTSTSTTVSSATSTTPLSQTSKPSPKKLESTIASRLESVFGAGMPLPGLARGGAPPKVGGRKVEISGDDKEQTNTNVGNNGKVKVMMGDDSSEKATKEKSGVDVVSNRPLTHITKDRPRRPGRSKPRAPVSTSSSLTVESSSASTSDTSISKQDVVETVDTTNEKSSEHGNDAMKEVTSEVSVSTTSSSKLSGDESATGNEETIETSTVETENDKASDEVVSVDA
ncbi:10329_t:CDS:2 [Paraglomus occultum]|uniref:10329_t:CDS:1 n=1 Tax=Paraglomus occultum TaxID=144539 RepID=A0A9N8Z7X7_9GLOM|nr:10329_t:CDS:2 [Paraglomus occultum]